MERAMKIEVWADIICPWCGLGVHRLKQALARFPHAAEVSVVHHSFQLDERASTSTEPVRSMLRHKMGASDAQIERMTGQIEQMAQAEGLQPYHVLDNRVGNTSLAHELAAWATALGRGSEMWDALFVAYFGEARSIFDVDSLAPLAARVGLDPDAARQALVARQFAEQVLAAGREARALGATGVPFTVIDRRRGIAGAQPAEAILTALQASWQAAEKGVNERNHQDARGTK
jgi:predicted DsbA family dithiol-disulfide isomerase